MSIELMKKLEDLEQTLASHYEQLSSKIDHKKRDYIKSVVSDFSRFFEEKEFKVISNTRLVEATYGKLKATLSYEDPSTDFFGVLFRFDLDFSGLNQPNVIVVLNKSKPGLSVSSTYSSNSEEERLKKSISQKEATIEEVKSRIENFDSERWSLFVKDDKQNPGYQLSEPYSSMFEILTELIK